MTECRFSTKFARSRKFKMNISIGDFVIINSPEDKWHKHYHMKLGLVVGNSLPSGRWVVPVKHYMTDSNIICQCIRMDRDKTWSQNSNGWPKTARLICETSELTNIFEHLLTNPKELGNRQKEFLELYPLLKRNFNEWSSGDILPDLKKEFEIK